MNAIKFRSEIFVLLSWTALATIKVYVKEGYIDSIKIMLYFIILLCILTDVEAYFFFT